jgi:hypothetical protein
MDFDGGVANYPVGPGHQGDEIMRLDPRTEGLAGISPRILGLMPAAAYLVKPAAKHTFVQAVRKHLYPSSHTAP